MSNITREIRLPRLPRSMGINRAQTNADECALAKNFRGATEFVVG